MAATQRTVKAFLDRFKNKAQPNGIIFLNRAKNRNALLALDILPADRKHYIGLLGIRDYSKGPEHNHQGGADVWVFGKTIKEQEVYIKITLKGMDESCGCISFHLAEHPIDYPFKNSA